MKINLKKLDSTIEKLQQLRRLATDPALADFVEITGRASSNGTGSQESPRAESNGHGSLKPAVLAACKALTGVWNVKNVYAKMQEQGYQPTSDSSDKSVANVLRALASDGTIRIAVQGSGRRPTGYSNS